MEAEREREREREREASYTHRWSNDAVCLVRLAGACTTCSFLREKFSLCLSKRCGRLITSHCLMMCIWVTSELLGCCPKTAESLQLKWVPWSQVCRTDSHLNPINGIHFIQCIWRAMATTKCTCKWLGGRFWAHHKVWRGRDQMADMAIASNTLSGRQ